MTRRTELLALAERVERGIKIDPSVPFPTGYASAIGGGGGRPPKFPWREMKVGESFFAAGYVTKKKEARNGEKIIAHQSGFSAVPGSKWTMRTCIENGIRGVRVWRAA